MEKLSKERIIEEIRKTEKLIESITGNKPFIFRFPGGNYNRDALKVVESLGYKVVHWSFESGDPDPRITPEKLANWVLLNVKQGSILIFHANGRGYVTHLALPIIVKRLKERGYTFGKLEDYLRSD